MGHGRHITKQEFKSSTNLTILASLVINDFYTGDEAREENRCTTFRRDFSTGKLQFNHRFPFHYNTEGVIESVNNPILSGLIGKRQEDIDDVILPDSVLLAFLRSEFPGLMEEGDSYADVFLACYSQGARSYLTAPLFKTLQFEGFTIPSPRDWVTDFYKISDNATKTLKIFQRVESGKLQVKDTNLDASLTIPGNEWIFKLTIRPAKGSDRDSVPRPAWKWLDTIVYHKRLFDLYMGANPQQLLKQGRLLEWFSKGEYTVTQPYAGNTTNPSAELLEYQEDKSLASIHETNDTPSSTESYVTTPTAWEDYEKRKATLDDINDYQVSINVEDVELIVDESARHTPKGRDFLDIFEKYIEGDKHHYLLSESNELLEAALASMDRYEGEELKPEQIKALAGLIGGKLLDAYEATTTVMESTALADEENKAESKAEKEFWHSVETSNDVWKKSLLDLYRITFDFGSLEGPPRLNIAGLVGWKRTDRSEQFAAFLGLPRKDENFVVNCVQYALLGFILTPLVNVTKFFAEFIPSVIELAAERARISLIKDYYSFDVIENDLARYTAKAVMLSVIAVVTMVEGAALLARTLTRRATSPVVAFREAWDAGKRIHPALGYVFAGASAVVSFGWAVLLGTVASPLLLSKGIGVAVSAVGKLPVLNTVGGYITTGFSKVFSGLGISYGVNAIAATLAIEFTFGTTLKTLFRKGMEKLKEKLSPKPATIWNEKDKTLYPANERRRSSSAEIHSHLSADDFESKTPDEKIGVLFQFESHSLVPSPSNRAGNDSFLIDESYKKSVLSSSEPFPGETLDDFITRGVKEEQVLQRAFTSQARLEIPDDALSQSSNDLSPRGMIRASSQPDLVPDDLVNEMMSDRPLLGNSRL